MNGIEKITARIEADARAEAAAVIKEAAGQAEAIRGSLEAKAKALYEEGQKETEVLCAERKQRLLGAAEMEAKKAYLACKQELVGEAFAKAEDSLLGLESGDYLNFLVKKAAAAAENGEGEILLNQKDREAFGEALVEKANAVLAGQGGNASLRLAADTGSFRGGFVLRMGSVTVNCTTEALIAQAKSEITPEVAAALFR